MKQSTLSQASQVRAHMLAGKSLTAGEAILVYGIFRLAARIHELRRDGMLIDAVLKHDARGKSYASYRLGHNAETPSSGDRHLEPCPVSGSLQCDCEATGCDCDLFVTHEPSEANEANATDEAGC